MYHYIMKLINQLVIYTSKIEQYTPLIDALSIKHQVTFVH